MEKEKWTWWSCGIVVGKSCCECGMLLGDLITSRYAYDTSSPYLYDPRLQEITNVKFTCEGSPTDYDTA